MSRGRDGGIFNSRKGRKLRSKPKNNDSDGKPSYLSGQETEVNYLLQNFCLAFVDLLGQKDAAAGHSLLPEFGSDDERDAFFDSVKKSVGAIMRLQKRSVQLLKPLLESPEKAPLRERLSEEQKVKWDQSQTIYINEQRWSDGLVYFSGLSAPAMVCPINAVLGIFMTAGSLTFLGLADRSPIRGAIDVAWGAELQKGEVYGPVVARAVDLESSAGCPRVVVSETVLPYLQSYIDNPEKDDYSEINRQLAVVCKDMILEDIDGKLVLNYLSESFRRHVTQSYHDDMYSSAMDFINAPIAEHTLNNDKILRSRYEHLKSYFETHA